MAKEALGYPSITEACWQLRQQGKRPREIAKLLNLTTRQVCTRVYARGKSANNIIIKLDRTSCEALSDAAAERGMYGPTLAKKLLQIIVDENMIDAILDDDDDDGPA